MAWVRIHDAALSHPKIIGMLDLGDPFDLWVWGLSYAQLHLTDGLVPADALPHGSRKAVSKLVLRKLWEAQEDGSFKIHDYLQWNDSKALVNKRQTEAKERMANARERRSREQPANVRSNALERTSQEVPLRFGLVTSSDLSERESERKANTGERPLVVSADDEALTLRAGQLLERYAELFYLHRNGARYHNRMHLDFQKAQQLVATWTDDARLEKLAVLVLTTDDEWVSRTDRGFSVFAAKASWADGLLAEWESKNGVAL